MRNPPSEPVDPSPAAGRAYGGVGPEQRAAARRARLVEAGAGGVRGALIARALVSAVVQVARMSAANGYREPRAEVVHSCVRVAVGTLRALQSEAAGR